MIYCTTCSRPLPGVHFLPGAQVKNWVCGECNIDSSDPLFCRQDDTVVFDQPEAGTPGDRDAARKYLNPGREYTVHFITLGRSSSEIELYEFPGIAFNSCMFTRVQKSA